MMQSGESLQGILNGVVGDYLVRERNPLAIEMAFYDRNQTLNLNCSLERQVSCSLSNKLVILIHGLTNTETIWNFTASPAEPNIAAEDSYGSRLQRDFSYTPFYLRYNTGLSIEENGRALNRLLEQLIAAYPIEVDELVLLGFSMGGLVSRCAQEVAVRNKMRWIEKLAQCFYLGTPHEGAPLEKFGHIASAIVRSFPRDYVNHWSEWIDVRSEGIQNLKDGLKHGSADSETAPVSFYAGAQHNFISGALANKEVSLMNRLFGDALVRMPSAHPQSAPEGSEFAHFDGIAHVPLAHSEKVYQQIKYWVALHGITPELHFYQRSEVDAANNTINEKVLSKAEVVAGVVDLAATAFEKTVDAVEIMNTSIAGEYYTVLDKVPVTRQVSNVVASTHQGLSRTVFGVLKLGGTLAHRGAKALISKG